MPAPSHRISFLGSQNTELAARLDLPAGPPRAYALFAHCFTCSKDIRAAGRIASQLNARGIAVMRFDFTGLGASEGEFANTDFSSNLEDLWLAAAWMRQHHHAPQLLIGHSLGGAACISVAGDIPEVRAVATIGAPSSTEHLTHLFADHLDELEGTGVAQVSVAGRSFTLRRDFLDDLVDHSVVERAAKLGHPLLILHSPIDEVVGIEHAAVLYKAARHPKSFVSLDGADHLLSRDSDAIFAADIIGTWASRYVNDQHPFAPIPAPSAPVVVAETTQGTFLNHVVAGDHRFLADEPTDVGGFDAGPSPYDLIAAGLGACTSMTLRLYADRKKIPLDRIIVEVAHEKVHLEDSESTSGGIPAQIDEFRRRIILDGNLSAEDAVSLGRIADRCPVHRTLERGSRITTTVVEH